MDNLKKDHYDNLEFRSYCSFLLMDIEVGYFNSEDKPWTIKEVKEYVIPTIRSI